MAKTLISSDMVVEGDIISESEIDVDGMVKGNVTGQSVSVLSKGKVDGCISAINVSVDGQVTGKIAAEDLSVNSSGIVRADVSYASITTEKGAKLDGKFMSK